MKSVLSLFLLAAVPAANPSCIVPPVDGGKPTPAPAATSVALPLAIQHATIWTGAGKRIEDGTILLRGGRIESVGGPETAIPAGMKVVDAGGRVVTPGIIDVHSHAGVYPSPSIDSTADGNEMVEPVTAQVSAEHGIWPQDPAFLRILAGGTTSLLVLPGSGNLIGGRGVAVHTRPGRTVGEMKIKGAPPALKMACGENPKRVYGQERKSAPMTRMGNVAGYRAAFQAAKEYKKKKDEPGGDAVPRDLKLETLAGVLEGKILVQNHCYRAEEMAQMIEIAGEFGYKIRAFHHALEAYKVRDLLKKNDIAVATWADWWGFKLEAWDGIPQNAALVHEAGVRAVIHSDSSDDAQHLNQEAAKALAYGRRAGIAVTEDDALTWITANPAWVLGMEKELGTLEKGKLADIVVWNGSPLSVYAKADLVYVEGALQYDRSNPALQPRTDFELGITR